MSNFPFLLRTTFAALVALSTHSATAGVMLYFDEGAGRIYLAGRCYRSTISCAYASLEVVPNIDDGVLEVELTDDRIIFKNDKYRFEKRLDELKIEITDPDSSSGLPPRAIVDAKS